MIKGLEDFLCITERKPHNIKIVYTQVSLLSHVRAFLTDKSINTYYRMELESTFQKSKKKWSADQAFNNDYLYWSRDHGTEWHFIMCTPNDITVQMEVISRNSQSKKSGITPE